MIYTLLLTLALAQWTELPCTMHDYEGPIASNPRLYDNAAPWCGQRYSVLNVARVVALPNMNPSLCNQCIEIRGEQTVYVLAIDQREAYGLDIASSSYQALFPNDNVLNPHTCSYRIVDSSYCGTICHGSAEECTVGVRNSLPGYLLPETGIASVGLGSSGSHSNSNDNKKTSGNQQPPNQQSNDQSHGTSGGHHQNQPKANVTVTTSTTRPSPTSQVIGSSQEFSGSRPEGSIVVSSASRFKAINFLYILTTILFY